MATANSALEPLISVDEAARILGRSHWTLRRDAKAGRVHAVRIGNSLKFEPSEIRRIMSDGLASARTASGPMGAHTDAAAGSGLGASK